MSLACRASCAESIESESAKLLSWATLKPRDWAILPSTWSKMPPTNCLLCNLLASLMLSRKNGSTALLKSPTRKMTGFISNLSKVPL